MPDPLTASEAERRQQWRLRREERRAKQRLANIGRAEKMHALRIAQPAMHSTDAEPREPRRIHVGCSGWYYWHWRDCFYPAELPRKDWFAHYASQFDTVELNAPFYSWPTPATVKTWIRQAEGTPLVYTIKACELITHVKRFSRTQQLVQDFGYIADLLGDRMGCFLFQLPPSFSYSAARLKRILASLEPGRRNVVEFRHKSWWNKSVYKAFEASGTIFCSCSGPRLPDELIQTADEIYVRFHGTKRWYRHDYTAAELAEWTKRVRSANPKRVWAYFNNDRDGHAIRNAREWLAQLAG